MRTMPRAAPSTMRIGARGAGIRHYSFRSQAPPSFLSLAVQNDATEQRYRGE